MIVEELMVESLVCVTPHEMFSSVVSLMNDKALSCVLVSQNGKPKGIVTERDVVNFLASTMLNTTPSNSHFQDVPVSDVMTIEPICIHKSTSLYDAISLARSHRARHLLVINEDEVLVGLVTQTDMTDAYIKSLERQTELEMKNQALYLLSHEDPLMRIGNRRAMTEALNSAGALAKRYKKTYSVALIDVDFFKKYNDHYGHQAGDDALVAIASAIKSSMRETDQLFRYGGEEILLLLPETEAEGALLGAERARKAVQAIQLPHKGSPLDKVTISIGVASGQGKEWQKLIACADQALYKAKVSGRNKVCAADAKDS